MKAVAFCLSFSFSLISTSLTKFSCKEYTSLSFAYQQMKITRDKHALGMGFKFCGILAFRWIWMASFLLNHILIRSDDFLLNIFGSVFGLQVTALISVSQTVAIVYCACYVEPWLWPAKKVSFIVHHHHVIKVTELVRQSLIQSPLLDWSTTYT